MLAEHSRMSTSSAGVSRSIAVRPVHGARSAPRIVAGAVVAPGAAYSYITRALRQTAPAVLGAMRLLAESYMIRWS
jgi:hypothetical protein